jgi:hypothetical protein
MGKKDQLYIFHNDERFRIETVAFFSDESRIFEHLLNIYFTLEN